MNKHIIKIIFTVCFSIIAFSLFGHSNSVKFYYSINGEVYGGSFSVAYELNVKKTRHVFEGPIDYDDYNVRDLKIKVTVSNLRWQYASHGEQYRLAFIPEILDAGEEITLITQFTQYLEVGSSRSFYYSPSSNISESTPTGLVITCLALKKDFDPEISDSDFDSSIANGNLVGLAMTVKPILLIPTSEISSQEELDFLWELYSAILDGVDENLAASSNSFAEGISEKNYTEAKQFLKNPSYSGSNVFRGGEIPEVKKRDPDQEGFVAAKRAGTISAYQKYLTDFPSGRYRKSARGKIINLTPFEYNQTRTGSAFLVSFTAGVGANRPALTLTDNDDYVIKSNWVNSKQVEINIPEERSTQATFRLGSKELKLDLENNFEPVVANISMTGEQLTVSNVGGGKAPYQVSFRQEGRKIYSSEMNTAEMVIDLSQIPLRKGSFTTKVLDIRKEAGATFNGKWNKNNVSAATSKSDSADAPADFSWFLLIPIFGGLFFLLYRRYSDQI